MGVRQAVTRNTLFNAAGRAWEAAAVLLILTPYVVPRVGIEAWGAWALVGAFTGYVALLDLGVASSYSKYIAEYAARGERGAISRVVSTGLVFYLALGLVLAVVGWKAIDWLAPAAMRLLARDATIGAGVLDEIRYLLKGALLLFCAANCVTAFSAVQTGLQRMGVTNALGFVASLVKLGTTIVFVEMGQGARALLHGEACALAVFGLGSIAAAFVLMPDLRVGPGRVDRAVFGRLVNFGWKTQVARLSNLIMFQTDKVVAGFVFGGLGLVGLYELGTMWANRMRQLPALLLTALVPAVSELDARSDEARLRELCLRSTRYMAILAVPSMLFLAASAGSLMRAWLFGTEGLDRAAWVLRILAVGYLANLLPGPGVTVALGRGRPEFQMKAGLVSMCANVLLTIALVYAIGFHGIPIATAASMFLSTFWFMRRVAPLTGANASRTLRFSTGWPLLASVPGTLACVAGDWFVRDAGRLPTAAVLAACIAFFAVSYSLAIAWAPFLDGFDADFLENTLRLGKVPGFGPLIRRVCRA